MENRDKTADVGVFSLLGGPLHRLGCRLGLVRNQTDTVGLGVALALLAWGILIALAFLVGGGTRVFSLAIIGGHVRLLVTIPMFFHKFLEVVDKFRKIVLQFEGQVANLVDGHI